MSIEDSFWSKVLPLAGCWNWTGAITGIGYGNLRSRPAHRVSYELFIGPIPPGLVIDHLCNNTICVRPDHLVATTQRENVLRGNALSAINARKIVCQRGHALIWNKRHTNRRCKECHAIRSMKSYWKCKKRGERNGS